MKKLEQENLPDSVRLSVQLGELVKASKQQKEKVSVDPFVLGDMDKIENELNEFYSLSDRVGLMSGVESFNSVYGPWSSASSSSAADASGTQTTDLARFSPSRACSPVGAVGGVVERIASFLFGTFAFVDIA